MENIPTYIYILFGTATLLTIYFLYKSTRSKLIIAIALVIMIVQTILSISHKVILPLLIGPSILGIVLLFILPKGRKLLDQFDQRWMTWLSIIRVPVEFVLLGLFLQQKVPQLMTFEGRNFDILSGITAPFIAYFMKKLSKTVMLLWNLICLGLLLNIVINAILSVPGPIQQFAFDQPNVAVLYFPFVWLPAIIVPAVLLSHLSNIRQLVRTGRYQ
jgi:hypothetical protein